MPREFEFQWDLITDIPQDWGSKLSESTTKLYMYQDSGERSSDATRDWTRLACECPGVSSESVGPQWPAMGVRDIYYYSSWNRGMLEQVSLKEVANTAITPTIVWPQAYPSAENWIKVSPSMALPTRARPCFPTASPSHQEACTSLLSTSIRGQTEWKPQSQKTNPNWWHRSQPFLT